MDKPKILIVDDEINIRTTLADVLADDDYEISLAADGEEAIELIAQNINQYYVVIADIKMKNIDGIEVFKFIKNNSPLTQLIFITAYGTIESAVQAIKEGAYDYIKKPILDINKFRTVVKNAIKHYILTKENIELKEKINSGESTDFIIGVSKKMQYIMELIRKISDTDVPILIEGESGTGKDMLAKKIHELSNRSKNAYVVINCGALPETLLENELFGHEKGAFTGAVNIKKGRFELAHQGTLFLDEITEMGKKAQTDLLRVIEDGVYYRIGGTKPIMVDVRIIAASNRDVKKCCEEGLFREDLYYRLNVVNIKMPPLRERKEDIPILVSHFVKKFCEKHKKNLLKVNSDVMNYLINYPWPGNIRELKNAIERAVLLSQGEELEVKHLPFTVQVFSRQREKIEIEVGTSMEEAEKIIIEKTLKAVNGHREKAANILKISRRTLQYKIKQYNIKI